MYEVRIKYSDGKFTFFKATKEEVESIYDDISNEKAVYDNVASVLVIRV